MIDWIFHLMNHAWVPWSGACLILAWGISQWVSLQRHVVAPMRRQLSNTILHLENMSTPPLMPAGLSPSLEAVMLASHLLAPAWTAFSETMVQANGEPTQPTRQNLQAFFNLESLIDREMDRHYRHGVPSILLSIGLLFTLMGLAAGLFFAIRELQTDTLADARHAMEGLLQSASFKFISSLCGMLTAALFYWEVKRQHRRLEHHLGTLCHHIHTRIEAHAQQPKAPPLVTQQADTSERPETTDKASQRSAALATAAAALTALTSTKPRQGALDTTHPTPGTNAEATTTTRTTKTTQTQKTTHASSKKSPTPDTMPHLVEQFLRARGTHKQHQHLVSVVRRTL